MISADSYTLVESRVLLDHAFVRMLGDTLEYQGRRRPYYYLESPVESVATLALTENREILLTRQYRHPIREVIFDLPAGRLSPGEDALAGARRELEEETGYRAGTLVPLGRFNPFPGSLKVTAHLFFATDLTPTLQRLDPDEELDLVLMPFDEVLAGVLNGEFIDGSLQMAMLLAAQKGLAG